MEIEFINQDDKGYRYAGFWMRLWAYLLDLLVIASINGILITPLSAIGNFREVELAFFNVEVILMAVVTFLYFLLLTKKWGQTIGKRVLGLKVISQNEHTLTWTSLIFREIVGRYILQAFLITYTLYGIVAFQKKKQGIHDLIGETYVIHDES
ncbi:RDD family protein [Anaerobacillus alkaliphilus]|uniref:RDD family protein n=1 Tax=Anaerobacillus alkaliphilus TaxID=1548597 RepID=UPI001F4F472D|nr:RDD family protein [Anaerobacillus alkaliphilus]